MKDCTQNDRVKEWNDQQMDQLGTLHHKKMPEDDHMEKVRQTWSRKTEYMLSMVGYSVGLGNVWRFPYVCIRNGGGAFLIPYFVCLVLCGLPLYFMEVAMGQFMSRGVYHIWNICPLFKGLGIGQLIAGFISSWYYAILLAWVSIYLVNSFKSPLPWTLCGQEWNTPACVPQGIRVQGITGNETDKILPTYVNGTGHGFRVNLTSGLKPASHEFWLNNVLELSPGLEDLGGLPWHTTVGLLVSCLLVVLCLIKGVKSLGKVVYVTATLPYILITVLIIKGLTLPGAMDGLIFYIYPDFSKLLQVQTWLEASLQVFYSLGPIWGGLVTMASYNKFQNNCLRDSVILTFLCEGTSVFAGFAIFTVLGHMAYNLNVPVANFSATGAGLAFVVYPEAVAFLPVPQLWGVLFFLMLFTVALDSQFVYVEIVLTGLHDMWPKFTTRWSVVVKVVYSSFQFLIALPFASRGGMYLFQLVDWYIAAFAAVAIGLLECVIVAWIYGAERFMDDIKLMTKKRPPYIFNILWRFITPVLLVILLVTTLMSYEAPTYEGYLYSDGAVAFGWVIAVIWFLPVPLVAAGQLFTNSGSILNRLKAACRPSPEWQPGDVSYREQYRQETRPLASFQLPADLFLYNTPSPPNTSRTAAGNSLSDQTEQWLAVLQFYFRVGKSLTYNTLTQKVTMADKLSRVREAIGAVPDFPKKGILFRDIFPVLRNPPVFKDLIDLLHQAVTESAPDVECIVGLDSRGFLFGPILAERLSIPFVPVRKKGKLPGEIIGVTYDLEYGSDTLEVQKNCVRPGVKVVIIDDLLATGGTLKAACDLMVRLQAEVCLCLVIIELTYLDGRSKVPGPVKSLITFSE
ncbi:Sodium- and chloride-dependent glycine transporter 2 [Bulinus truncatus]|nr:Sodium- and chloride-dependent glycine transporter 2 [Bulinus truncatus]